MQRKISQWVGIAVLLVCLSSTIARGVRGTHCADYQDVPGMHRKIAEMSYGTPLGSVPRFSVGFESAKGSGPPMPR
jgi:hypothetical protein